jgi:hypothetical protein
LSAYGGNWSAYEDELHTIFLNEIANGGLTFRGQRVSCRRIPETSGKWFSFWHLVQEGKIEDDREPDLRRCERIRWIAFVIANAESHPDILWWENERRTERNMLLWFRQEYLVVLSRRDGYWLLKTAYCTVQSGRVRQLRKEHDEFHRPKNG